MLCFFFHLADISNPAKPWSSCKKWTNMLFEEFFAQGDLERQQGLPISYLMDRHTVNIARSQIGFIDVIISPAFLAAGKVINMEPFLLNIESNKKRWHESFDDYERRMLQE